MLGLAVGPKMRRARRQPIGALPSLLSGQLKLTPKGRWRDQEPVTVWAEEPREAGEAWITAGEVPVTHRQLCQVSEESPESRLSPRMLRVPGERAAWREACACERKGTPASSRKWARALLDVLEMERPSPADDLHHARRGRRRSWLSVSSWSFASEAPPGPALKLGRSAPSLARGHHDSESRPISGLMETDRPSWNSVTDLFGPLAPIICWAQSAPARLPRWRLRSG